MDYTQYPQPLARPDDLYGLYPTDFIVEHVLDEALADFRRRPEAAADVFGRLMMPEVSKRYGQKKIDEIATYLRSVEIRIIQSFPVEDTQMPIISINLGDSISVDPEEGLGRHAGQLDTLGPDGDVVGREEIGYIPIQDSLLIGIHAVGTPDKVKYLYYLVAHALAVSFERFAEMGFFDVSLRATDMSRFNDLLPESVFTRFLTLSMKSLPKFKKGQVPMVAGFDVNIRT